MKVNFYMASGNWFQGEVHNVPSIHHLDETIRDPSTKSIYVYVPGDPEDNRQRMAVRVYTSHIEAIGQPLAEGEAEPENEVA